MAAITEKIQRQVMLLDENKTALEAAVLMSENHIGSVVVSKASRVTGIFTERDLMRFVVKERKDPATVKLKEVMRTDVTTVAPDEQSERCIELMKKHQCRHLLVYEGEAFVGVISLRDLLVMLVEEKEELIRQLTGYITS